MSLFSGLGDWFKKRLDDVTGTNIQAGVQSIQNANQQIQQQPPKFGVLAQPEARQDFVNSQNQGQFNVGKAFLTAASQAKNKALPELGVGVARSLTGTAEGLSGLFDLATPGTGTSRITKSLVNYGGNIDNFAKQHNMSPAVYKIGQGLTEASSFLAPSLGAEAASRAGKFGDVLSSTKPLLEAKGLKYVTTPANLLNSAIATTRAQGSMAARGQDINAKTVGTSAATNLALGAGLNVVGEKIANPISNKIQAIQKDAQLNKLSKEQVQQKLEVQKLRTSPATPANEKRLRELRKEMKFTDDRYNEINKGGYVMIPGRKDGGDTPLPKQQGSNTPQFVGAAADLTSPSKPVASKQSIAPQGFILKETKPRNGLKDTVRVKATPEGLKSTVQTEQLLPETMGKGLDAPIVDVKTQAARDELQNSAGSLKNDRPSFMQATNDFLGQRNAARTSNIVDVQKLPKLNDNQSLGLIDAVEQGIDSGDFSQVKGDVRNLLDNKFAQLRDAGVDINYLTDYFPHKWKNATQDEVNQAYQSLNLRSGIQNARTVPTVSEGIKLGFQPATSDYRQAVNNYLNAADRLLANKQYFDNLKTSGMIVEAGTRPNGLVAVDAPGMPAPRPFTDPETGITYQGSYYARPDVAKEINKLFSPDEGNKVLRATAKTASGAQQLFLSGGAPGTPLNSFGAAQWLKQSLAGRPVSATKDFFRSFSEKATQAYEKKNLDYITKMEQAGVPYRGTLDGRSLQTLGEQISEASGVKKLGPIWNKAIEDPTFRRFLPTLQLDTFKGVYEKALKTTGDEAQAVQIAANATKNAFGLNDLAKDALKSTNQKNAVSTAFFAPRFRESMINFWVNNVKSIKDPLNPANRENVKFLINATVLFGAMQAANQALNDGNSTFQNPSPYDKFNLNIPVNKLPQGLQGVAPQDGSISVPFLSSTFTVPKMAINSGIALAKGDLGQVGVQAKGALSQVARPTVDLLTNTKYNNKPITYTNQSPSEKAAAQAKYVAGQFNHPWVNAALNPGSSPLETVSTALEAPVKFRDANQPGTSNKNEINSIKQAAFGTPEAKRFLKLSADEQKSLAMTDPNARALYEQLKAFNSAFSGPQLRPVGMSVDNTKVLDTYDRLTSQGKDKFLTNANDNEYKLKLAQYQQDKLGGKISQAEDIKKQTELAKAKVGASYEKDVRDLYGINEKQLLQFLQGDGKGKALAEKLIAYDQALYKAGLISKPKYAGGIGAKGNGGGRTYNLLDIASVSAPSPIKLADASAPKLSLKSAKRGVKVAKRGTVKIAAKKIK